MYDDISINPIFHSKRFRMKLHHTIVERCFAVACYSLKGKHDMKDFNRRSKQETHLIDFSYYFFQVKIVEKKCV